MYSSDKNAVCRGCGLHQCFHPNCNDQSALFRVNAKGQPGVWACAKHIKNTDARVDPQVKELVDVIRRAPR